MITYNEAKEMALGLNRRVNACKEYEKAYHFYEVNSSKDGDNGVVILKEKRKAINFVTFILDYKPEKNPKKIKF